MKTRKRNKRIPGILLLQTSAKKKIAALLLFVCGMVIAPAWSQCATPYEDFPVGEKIKYELSFNWKFVWTKAGTASLEFDDTTYNSQPAYRLTLIAAGNKRADLFFKLRDTLSSVISSRLEPMYFRKGAIEGSRYWVDEAFFSYPDGVSHVKQIRTTPEKVTEVENSDSRCIHDLLSVLAWARVMNPDDYLPGDKIGIPVATGRRVEEQSLVYRGRGVFKADNGVNYNCLLFSLVGDRKDKEKEVMAFNITDDKNRIPVRIDLFLKFGAAKASLTEVTGNKYPFTSIVTP